MKFTELPLAQPLLETLNKMGFEECTPIQERVIPTILQGRDISGLAQTGTGKTAAFLLPTMTRIYRSKNLNENPLSEEEKEKLSLFENWKAREFALVLVPTRELAEQVFQDFSRFSPGMQMNSASVYGGTRYEDQLEALKRDPEIIISTPGRLIDIYKKHLIDLKLVRSVIFDEADRMFDMGFKDDMKYLLQRIPNKRQILLFSATLNFDVLTTIYRFGAEPVEFDVSRDQTKAENVKDKLFHVGTSDKPKFLLSLLKKSEPRQAIIFSNFRHNVDRVSRFLNKNGFKSVGISSLLTQNQRNRVIERFKGGEDNILVATDVAARGLDIKGVDVVINYELPESAEGYVHRIGRTGRAGETGHAYSLVGDADVDALMRIEEYLKHKVEIGWLEDSDLITDFIGFPSDDSYKKRKEGLAMKTDGSKKSSQDRDGKGDRKKRSRRSRRGKFGNKKGSRDSDNRDDRREQRDNQEQRDNREQRVKRDQRDHKRDSRINEKRNENKTEESVHRDRKSGRHSQKDTPENRKSGPRKRNYNRKGKGSSNRRRRNKSENQGPSSDSVLKKVSRFFKNLFE